MMLFTVDSTVLLPVNRLVSLTEALQTAWHVIDPRTVRYYLGLECQTGEREIFW